MARKTKRAPARIAARAAEARRSRSPLRLRRKGAGASSGRPLFPSDPEGAAEPFFDLAPEESSYESSRVVILPVPFGGTVTYGGGTERGPEAIRAASRQVELFDEETRREPYKAGLHAAPPLVYRGEDPEPLLEEVARRVQQYLQDGKFVVTVGGEHSISSGAVRAYAKAFPGLVVVQFDAHSDLRESYQGSRHNHACAAARIREHARLVQIGIRSQSSEERDVIDRGQVDAVFAHEMAEGAWEGKALRGIPRGRPVYVTVDLDYFDPSIMPSTGTPEPGGGAWYPTLRFLRRLADQARIVGFDVMELAPVPGRHAPDFLAARLIYKLLAYVLE